MQPPLSIIGRTARAPRRVAPVNSALDRMKPIRVRPALPEDLAHLPAIEQDAAARFPLEDLPPGVAQVASVEELQRGLGEGMLWVAERESGRPLGFVLCHAEGSHFHILEMDVLTSHSGQGIGGALLQAATDAALRAGFRTMTLTTFEHLDWNGPFYAKRGFHNVVDLGAYPHLRAALQAEAARGLHRRVAMVKHAV